MGMFDEVYIDNTPWQTKDFDCSMEKYYIINNRLIKEVGHYEPVPKEERPHPNDEGFMGMAGSIKWIKEKMEDTNFHGIIHLSHMTEDKHFFYKKLKFTDGNLVETIEGERSGVT